MSAEKKEATLNNRALKIYCTVQEDCDDEVCASEYDNAYNEDSPSTGSESVSLPPLHHSIGANQNLPMNDSAHMNDDSENENQDNVNESSEWFIGPKQDNAIVRSY